MTKNKNHKAFSLIEISMVILVIGILIAGISNGVDLYDDYRLKVAQNLTKNSRVNRIPDLEMWLETTSENSLATGAATFTDKPNPADLDPIGRWNNINPNILPSARNHATQVTSTDKQPKYIRKGMNGLPALKFDGTDDFFSFNGNFLIGSDYTIFVVEARSSNKGMNLFLSGNSNSENSNLHLGYRSDISITQAHFNNDISKSVSKFTSAIPRMHSFVFSKINGKAIYNNGGDGSFSTSQKLPLISYPGSAIGNFFWSGASYYYQGSIAEIIFYSRALNDPERQGVEAYLAKKWGVKIV
jgi:prepilin-type N-terminal cleavage/methylation domain-containing protein